MRSSYGRSFAVMLALTAGGPALAAVECSSVTYCLQGNTDAMNALGEMYREGMGVPQDLAEALRWFRVSAKQGNTDAMNALGMIYLEGQGIPQDLAEALRWFRVSAEQGNLTGMNALGQMYREGMGIPQDYVRAHMWYSLSAFVSGGRFSIGAAGRDFIVDLMTPAQIDEAQQLAREWLELRTYGLTRP